ncbi:acyl-homoserine-lactone synthase [Sagittula sp. S175]|uniref:acyl-homoserine-lactone synthase n=1 Tax=Sagittula sp. S175 TaxID=3415129 RepID=UPI003C7A1CB6
MRTLVINALNLGEHHRYWLDHFRLRREIFVDRLGWNLPGSDDAGSDMEFDSFDTPATHYVLAIDDADKVCAVSRLVPTTVPYMIQTLWPDWPQQGCPNDARIWEASRFGCAATLSHADRQAAIRALYAEIYRFGQRNNIDHYLMVMPRFIFERLIRPNGYQVDYVGETRKFDGVSTCLGKVTVHPETATDASAEPLRAHG